MNKQLMFTTAFAAGLAASLILPTAASAHNAGHFYLPSGECRNVGAGNDVALPGGAQAPSNGGFLDLIPGRGDQFGARYAADQGNTPILGGFCR